MFYVRHINMFVIFKFTVNLLFCHLLKAVMGFSVDLKDTSIYRQKKSYRVAHENQLACHGYKKCLMSIVAAFGKSQK